MSRFKTRRNEKHNRGFSLVELVVAIGILAVIGTIVAFMMTSSSKNYRRMSLEAQLQSEAQLVANTISEYAIDAYEAKSLFEVSPSNPSPGAQYVNVADKILILRSNVDVGGTWVTREYVIALDDAEDKLYLLDRDLTDPDDPTTWTAFHHSLMGTYIDDFTVDLSHVEKDNIIDFKLNYLKNERTYEGNYQVLMRNRAYADSAAAPASPASPDNMILGLTPKQIYIDIVDGEAGDNYYINEVVAGTGLSLATNSNQIGFTASVVSTRSGVGNDVEWNVGSGLLNAFDFTPADGSLSQTGILKLKDGIDYDADGDVPEDDFTFTITKSVTNADGTTLSGTPKQAKVHLRRVKKIDLLATSGSTSWKKLFDDLDGVKSDEEDVRGYCYADSYGNYQTMNLNASIIQKWVPYAGGLEWKLEMRPKGSDEWTEDVSSRYARLAASTTDASTSNSVIFGKGLANGQLFRVTVTSKFDRSKSATYVFGVAPWKMVTGGGFNSRGYYTSLNEYFSQNDFSGFNGDLQKLKDDIANNRPLIMEYKCAGGTLEEGAFKLVSDAETGEWFLYIDYAASKYQYSGDEMLKFYNGKGIDVEIYIWEANADGSKATEYANLANPFYYWLQPVFVHSINDDNKVYVIAPGSSSEAIKTQMDAYNIIGEEYLGLYVDNGDGNGFSANLNGASKDANANLTVEINSGYGDVRNYVDKVTTTLTAKAPSNIRNANIMTFRVAAEPYYRLVLAVNNGNEYSDALKAQTVDNSGGYRYNSSLSVSTAPVVDYKVVVANVIGDNSFIYTPQTAGFPTSDVKGATKTNTYKIKGYDSDGNSIEVGAYYESGVYKCIYKGVVYTYNQTYHYWSK